MKINPFFGSLAAISIVTGASHAAIVAPYTADSNTRHLYHFDEASTANVTDDSGTGNINPSKQNGATLGNAGFTGFGNAGNTSAAADSIIRSSVNSPGLVSPPTGANGAFTYEAMINISTTSGGQHIFSMDQNSNTISDRPFFFRINNGDLSFQNIGNGNVTTSIALPTTGPDAFVANQWFHVAATYNGIDNTPDNLKLYWTLVDEARTEASLLGTGSMGDLSGTAVYGFGNAFRTVGSGVTQNLEGSIDEVRLSSVARGANEMLFVPEPSTALLGALGALCLLRRRR